jgi:glucosyl-dolichyl phosphate glucuronosyltransferase
LGNSFFFAPWDHKIVPKNTKMTSRPVVSLVICTYNREKFLKDCLSAILILDASPQDFETIIVDNNSTDSTQEILHQFKQSNPALAIKIAIETKQGLSHARNRGIMESEGEYIAFIDDDAIPRRDYIQQLIKFARANPNIMGFGGKIIPSFIDGPAPKWTNPYSSSLFFSQVDFGDQVKLLTKDNQYPFGCNMVIKTSYFKEHETFDSAIGPISKDGGRCDDKVLFRNMRKKKFEVFYVPELYVTHQIDTHRLTNSYIRKLSEGLGYSLKLLAVKEGWLAILKRSWDVFFKMAASITLATGYTLTGRWAVAVHLIQFRWWVMRGYMG